MKYIKSYLSVLLVTAVLMGIYAYADSRPEKVVLTSDKWECVIAVPKGLATACVNYKVK